MNDRNYVKKLRKKLGYQARWKECVENLKTVNFQIDEIQRF